MYRMLFSSILGLGFSITTFAQEEKGVTKVEMAPYAISKPLPVNNSSVLPELKALSVDKEKENQLSKETPKEQPRLTDFAVDNPKQ
jgi:hypothetical protein